MKFWNKEKLLLTPGPVKVPNEILRASARNIFHRSVDFEVLYEKCTKQITNLLGGDDTYRTLLIAGSGTVAIDSFIQTMLKPENSILVVSNGHFGERLVKVISVAHKEPNVISTGFGNILDIKKIEYAIKEHKPDWLLCVAHETSSGVQNPIDDIGNLCSKYGVKLMVDGVSAVGGMAMDLVKNSVTACVSVPNKGLESLPGVSFICLRKNLFSESLESRVFSIDLNRYYEFSKKKQMPSTPSTNSILALSKALDLFENEGLVNRIARYKKLTNLSVQFAKRMNIDLLIESEEDRFPGLLTMVLPEHISARSLHEFLLNEGFVILFYNPSPEIGNRNIFQISVMGNIFKKDIVNVFDRIRIYLKEHA